MVARWVTGKIPCGSPSLNWESPQTERSHGTARNLARQGKSSDPRWRRGRQLLPDRSACGRDDRLGRWLDHPGHWDRGGAERRGSDGARASLLVRRECIDRDPGTRGRISLAGECGDRDGGLLQRLLLESDPLEAAAVRAFAEAALSPRLYKRPPPPRGAVCPRLLAEGASPGQSQHEDADESDHGPEDYGDDPLEGSLQVLTLHSRTATDRCRRPFPTSTKGPGTTSHGPVPLGMRKVSCRSNFAPRSSRLFTIRLATCSSWSRSGRKQRSRSRPVKLATSKWRSPMAPGRVMAWRSMSQGLQGDVFGLSNLMATQLFVAAPFRTIAPALTWRRRKSIVFPATRRRSDDPAIPPVSVEFAPRRVFATPFKKHQIEGLCTPALASADAATQYSPVSGTVKCHAAPVVTLGTAASQSRTL